jgi:hypothetical protein
LWITMHFRVTFFFLLNPEGCIIVGYMLQYWISVCTTSPWEILEIWVFDTVNRRSVNSSSVVDQSRRVFLLRAKHKHYFLKAWFWFTCCSFVGLKCSGLLGGLMIHHCSCCRCSTLIDVQNL